MTKTPEAALEDCRLFAAKRRKEEWAKTILRFCEEGGSVLNPLRGMAPRCYSCGYVFLSSEKAENCNCPPW